MSGSKMMASLMRGLVAVSMVALAFGDGPALAQDFPTKPIRILVNTGPGGLVDVTTRLVATKLGGAIGQSVVVENRAGGDGLVGILAVKNAQPDGYTLLATAGTVAIQPAVKANPGYDLEKDLVGIGPMMRSPLLIMVGAGQPDKTIDEFMARARSSPGKMTYASAGVGTTTHIGAARFLKEAKLDLLHIPYKGNGPAMPDVMAGRVDMIFEAYGSGVAKVRDGTLRALAVTSTERLPALADVPTFSERSVPGFSYYLYISLLAPAGTPQPVIERLSRALKAALEDPTVQARFAEGGGEAMIMPPAEFNVYLKEDLVRMEKLVSELGIPKQ